MVKIHRVASLIVALGLVAPSLAEAQAIPRTTGSSSSGSTSSGSSGSSTSSAGSGGTSTSGGSSGSSSSGSGVVAPPSGSTSSWNPGLSGSTSSRIPAKPGTPPARTAPAPGGVAKAVPAGEGTVSSSSSARTGTGATTGASGLDLRLRGNRPITGLATPRVAGGIVSGDFVSFPFFGPWGRYYPWYTPGFGWSVGFMGYNPWSYGATCWQWGRYGPWYDPYSYCWNSYWIPPASASSEAGRRAAAKPRETMGSVRIKANPATAKVYIDNALVGTVDEFDGLSNHLEIAGGRHVLQLRADGFLPHTEEIVVTAGRTQTVRISLKKTK